MTEVFTRHVAYSLQSDILPRGSHLAEDQAAPAPKSLEPAPGLSVSKFRRAEHVAAPADAAKGEKPVSAEDEVALARRQIAAFAEARARGEGVAVVDGRIGENLHVAVAEALIGKAEAIAAQSIAVGAV